MAELLEPARRVIRDYSLPIARVLGVTRLPEYAPQLIASAFAWWALHVVVAPAFSSLFFPRSYGRFRTARERNNWNIRIVSFVHALVILPLSFRNLYLPALVADHAFGWDPAEGTLVSIACGYFLWDTLESLIHFSDPGFVVHGLSCFFIYFLSYRPFIAYYGPRFLLWELSTPFLNIHWFLDKMNLTGSTLQLINGLILLSTFAGTRLIYGMYQSYTFYLTLWSIRDEAPRTLLLVYGIGNVILSGLNVLWFVKMISALRKRMAKPHVNGNGNAMKDRKAE